MPNIDKAIKALEHFKYNYQRYCDCSAIDDAIELLKSQPQIVRCKDCKHGRVYDVDCVACEYQELSKELNWFCADGEPREMN